MTKRWSSLKAAIESLRVTLLPTPFDPTGVYPDTNHVQVHTRAFLVLSHAEIESYLEEWAKDIARASEKIWTSASRVTRPLTFLVAANAMRVADTDSLKQNAKDSHRRFAELVAAVFLLFYKRIKVNNGIKERNVLRLFDPLGVPAVAYSPTLLPNLDTLGGIRGEHAHYSGQAVKSVLDPETEYKRIGEVLIDLETLEKWLVRYRRAIR